MKKIMCVVCLLALTLTGCSYSRDENPGEVVEITVSQMQEMIDKEESFAIVFTQTTCEFCKEMMAMVDTYILEHNVKLYDVVLDKAPEDKRKEELAQVRKTFVGLKNTPSLYYVKDGKLEESILGEEVDITKDRFDSFVQKHKLDEKK